MSPMSPISQSILTCISVYICNISNLLKERSSQETSQASDEGSVQDFDRGIVQRGSSNSLDDKTWAWRPLSALLAYPEEDLPTKVVCRRVQVV